MTMQNLMKINPCGSMLLNWEELRGWGGNLELQCNLCNHLFKGSYIRVKAHFLKIPSKGVCYCKKMTYKDHEKYQRETDEAELRAKNAQPKLVPLPPPTTTSKRRRGANEVVGGSAKKGNKSPLESAFNMNVRDQLHNEIARMFYSGGLPFNLARNPYYAILHICRKSQYPGLFASRL